MFKKFCLLLLVAFAFVLPDCTARAAGFAGFQEIRIPKTGALRGLDVAIWYPTNTTTPITQIGENPAFFGEPVIRDAPLSPGRHPLVVMSHGFGGNWRNQAWLAIALVKRGYIVAAPNHPGTTSRDMRRNVAARLWQRPGDISHVITFMTIRSSWASAINRHRIAVIGHSLGGWTALEIAGANFDANRLMTDCQKHPRLAACEVYKEIGAGGDVAAQTSLGRNLRDPMVDAVVSLDLGLARGFTPQSLAAVKIPVLVIAAGGHNPEIPSDLESGYLRDHLPKEETHYVKLAGAAHFSFLQRCKPGAGKLLDADHPGDSMICLDGDGKPGDRLALHQKAEKLIVDFLATALADQK